MAKKRVMVGVDAVVHQGLVKLRDKMFSDYQEGRIPLPFWEGEEPSLSSVIAELISRDESHRKRAKASRKRRSQSRSGDSVAAKSQPDQS